MKYGNTESVLYNIFVCLFYENNNNNIPHNNIIPDTLTANWRNILTLQLKKKKNIH